MPDAGIVSSQMTGSSTASQRVELAAFLRSRRERITPDQLGLPDHGRRRTPGLRREEVAQHAGVGVTWYTWLEQARDINVSQGVLDAIARTLLLDPHERGHLFTLAGSPLTEIGPDVMPVSEEVRLLLNKLHPYPACVTNGRYDLLAYNQAYSVLIGDLDSVAFDQRNTLWLAFTSPTMRGCMLDWDTSVRRMVAQYRAAMADHVGEPVWKCMVKRLQDASPEFAELWKRHDVAAPENLAKRFQHGQLGRLNFTFTNLWLQQKIGVRLVTYVPSDAQTASALARVDEYAPRALVLAA
jgi:MmyB-like transcription regulator ligand binding domain/Helix-turn-helix domain